jgi:ribosomal-protein-alanine N-acetyltransferase
VENRPVPLHTARLTLRPLTPDDAAFILALLNDADFLRNIGDRGARTLDDARAYITNGPVASYERYGHGLLLVVLTATGEPIGICGLLKRETLDDIDIGFAFMPEFRGHGYAFESAEAVKTYAQSVMRLTRLVAIVQPDNHKSIRLLERIGLHNERTVRLSPDDRELLLFLWQA